MCTMLDLCDKLRIHFLKKTRFVNQLNLKKCFNHDIYADADNNICTASFLYALQQILKQVSKFVKGSRRDGAFGDKDLTQSALFLLKNLPSARHAVLQYLGGVFQDAVSASLHSHESGSAHGMLSTDQTLPFISCYSLLIHLFICRFHHKNIHYLFIIQ